MRKPNPPNLHPWGSAFGKTSPVRSSGTRVRRTQSLQICTQNCQIFCATPLMDPQVRKSSDSFEPKSGIHNPHPRDTPLVTTYFKFIVGRPSSNADAAVPAVLGHAHYRIPVQQLPQHSSVAWPCPCIARNDLCRASSAGAVALRLLLHRCGARTSVMQANSNASSQSRLFKASHCTILPLFLTRHRWPCEVIRAL